MPIRFPLRRTAQAVAAAAAIVLAQSGAAAGIDRPPFQGGAVGAERANAGAERRFTGAERIGSGAERSYYGAEGRGRPLSGSRAPEFEEPIDGFDEDWNGLITSNVESGASINLAPSFDGADGSFIYYGDGEAAADDEFSGSGPRVIDVEGGRRDAGPAQSGVSISFVGGTKIIRIAGPAGRSMPDAAIAADRPADADAGFPAPWSREWARRCAEAHDSFDRRRGTFAAANGRETFCLGE